MLSVSIKPYLPYLLLGVITSILFWSPDPVKLTLEYNRSALANGELWRLFSGHLLHSNLYHLLLNLAGLLVIMLLHAPLPHRLNLGWQILILGLATSLGLWLFSHQIDIYVGLSGVLHGILCFGAVLDIRQGYRSGVLILLGVAAKLAFEQYAGPDAELAAKIAAEVAIDAHLYGAISGVLLGLLLFNRTPRR
ncbi:rhombosortase [Alishewanella longhuensis]